jgi:thiol:disulfide interchange protein DsbD
MANLVGRATILLSILWAAAAVADGDAPMSEGLYFGHLMTSIQNGQVLWSLVLSCLAGVAASLSPCVYPLIPITISIMGAQNFTSRTYGFITSCSYVFGMSLVYSVLGIVFASLGSILGSFMQSTPVLVTMALFFALTSLFLFGVWDIVLPTVVTQKLAKIGGRGIFGAFLMGLAAGVIAAPCTGPVLGVILALIASKQDLFLGMALMVSFSLGVGLLFLVIGTFSSVLTNLPKAGPWMLGIKRVMASAVLGVSLYYLSLAVELPGLVTGLLAASKLTYLAIMSVGIFLLTVFLRGNSPGQRMIFGAGIFLMSIGVFALLRSPLLAPVELSEQPLAWTVFDGSEEEHGRQFDEKLKSALAEKRPVLIDFYADWCVLCSKLDKVTFQNPQIAATLQKFELIKIDATNATTFSKEVEQRYKVTGFPAMVLIGQNQKPGGQLIFGFIAPQKLLPILTSLL